jgi:membrane protein DedA with SNARE-associated domain
VWGPVITLALLGAVTRFGYAGVTAVVFVESFGIPAPGETAIIAGSALGGSGRLNVFVVAIAAFCAAVIGDSIGYLIGRTGGHRLIERFGRYVGLTPARFEHVERFMARRGAIMVMVARFVEGLRQFNGIVAGATEMPFRRFLVFNALGAALWVGVWSTVGYFAGDHLDAIEAAIHRYQNYAIALAAVVVLLWVARRVQKRRRKKAMAAAVKAETDSPSPVR